MYAVLSKLAATPTLRSPSALTWSEEGVSFDVIYAFIVNDVKAWWTQRDTAFVVWTIPLILTIDNKGLWPSHLRAVHKDCRL